MSRKSFDPWASLEKPKPVIDWSEFVEISLESEPASPTKIFSDSESSSEEEEYISQDDFLDITKDITVAYDHVKELNKKISINHLSDHVKDLSKKINANIQQGLRDNHISIDDISSVDLRLFRK